MFTELFSGVVEWILAAVSTLGYFGIFILMTIESSFVPLPAELILIPAGALVARGEMSFVLVLVASTLGSVAGALVNYYIALFFGRKTINYFVHRYGKFVFINEETVLKSEKFFEKHGSITTFIGRLVPGVRSFVSLPAGFAKMNLIKFCVYTALGAGLWNLVIIVLGYLFGNNLELIEEHLHTITIIVVVLAVAGITGYVLWQKKFKK